MPSKCHRMTKTWFTFRIPETELKPRIVSVQRGVRRFPGRTNYSKEKYCDSDFFERQVQGLWGYIQKTGPQKKKEPEATRTAPNHGAVWALIHPEIVKVSKTRFDTQHFADAAEAAFKLINERVRTIVKERTGSECDGATSSVITSKAANGYHFKTGQRDWPSRTENVLTCRLLWWQVGFGAPAPRAALEHVSVVQ